MWEVVDILNNNRVVWGVTMLLLNMGSRFVAADLGKFHESLLTNEYVKKIIVFSMFFVATRDIFTSFMLTILYVLIVDGLLHEKRKICILPNHLKQSHISENEYLKAKQTVISYETKKPIEQKDEYINYLQNIHSLSS
jgi:hypothetical protein